MSEAEELKNEIKTFLRSKGMTGDLNTLRYKPTLEEGTIVDWFAEFYHHKMREVLEESENHFKYQTKKKSVDFIDGVLSALNHFKTKIKGE